MLTGDLRNRLIRSRQALSQGLASLLGKPQVDDEALEDLEDVLIGADVGVMVSQRIVEQVKKSAGQQSSLDTRTVIGNEMVDILGPAEQPVNMTSKPYVMMVVGVNGVGKTTSVAKMAHYFKSQGKSVLLAAADTFRAAAIEQLQVWGDRLQIPVIAQGHGSDAAAVAHDALTSAISRNVDILLVDTAGRQHTHSNLMEQLKKIRRVLSKVVEGAPHEIIQVLDATTGQNAISQLRHFNDAVGVNSLCLTKLDGTAKGGVVLAITQDFQLPIRFIGVGETPEDLRPFQARAFVDALISKE